MSHPAAHRIVDLYREGADDWADRRGRTGTADERPWMLRFATALPPGGAVLDVGCGSGWPHAARLIEDGFAVTGVDSSGPLLRHARTSLPAGEWIEQDMRRLDLGPRRFDGVLAWWSLFHLSPDDQRQALPGLLSCVAPGGVFMTAVGREPGDTLGEWRGEPLYHGSLAADEYRALLEEAGFRAEVGPLSGRPDEGGDVWLAYR